MLNLSALKNLNRVRKYAGGTAIARVGSMEMVVILKGEAAVYRDTRPSGTPDMVLGPGDSFGEEALFLCVPQPSTIVAATDVFALTVSRDTILSFIQEEPEMALEIMKMLCGKLEPQAISTALPTAASAQPAKPASPTSAVPASLSADANPMQQPMAPAPAHPAPVVVAPTDADQSGSSPLFPEGHGSYHITLNNSDSVHLMDKSYVCPVCKKEFNTRKVKASKLIVERTDRDMRIHYQGVEPLYYDVATCPNCLFSALIDMFTKVDIIRPDLRRELQAFQPDTVVQTGDKLDTFSVFAGYYLALFCAPKCFTGHKLAEAKLLLKLSRIYQDCGDEAMEHATAKKALDAYLDIYLNENNDPAQDQQLCAVLGELYIKQGDMKNARDYYFKAKTNRQGSPVLKIQAENRLVDIREMEKAKAAKS